LKLSESLRKIGQPMPYYPSIARVFGVKATVLLCRLVWWMDYQSDEDGWICKSQEELTEETGMSEKEQATARKSLKVAGILHEKYQRLDHKMFYRIDIVELDRQWEAAIPETPNGSLGNGQTPKRHFGKPPSSISSKRQSGISSIGQEETKGTVPKREAQTAIAVAQPSEYAHNVPWPEGEPPNLKPEGIGIARRDKGITIGHARFIELWMAAWEAKFGRRYKFGDGKDGKAVKLLLDGTKRAAEDLIEVAKAAWDRVSEFPFDSALSVAGFNSRFNEIQGKLLLVPARNGHHKPEARECQERIEAKRI
jgi:hypothetical protein